MSEAPANYAGEAQMQVGAGVHLPPELAVGVRFCATPSFRIAADASRRGALAALSRVKRARIRATIDPFSPRDRI
jgi:hypothetical protein